MITAVNPNSIRIQKENLDFNWIIRIEFGFTDSILSIIYLQLNGLIL